MKKTKLSLCMISCLLAVGSLAGCEKKIKSSSDGVLLTYYLDGESDPHKIYADEMLEEYYDDSSKYQSIYDTIYSVIVRNYFTKDRGTAQLYEGAPVVNLGLGQMDKINRDAREKVRDDKDTALSNAGVENEGSAKYKKEFEAILASKGVDSEDELFQKYVEELQKETFEDNFYKYKIEELKAGDANGAPISVPVNVEGVEDFKWNGYINDQLPYHVSHVMVALDDSSDTNYADGTISKENAKKLYNTVTDLANPNLSFAYVAKTSDDKSSGEKEGDLGIMDYSTLFINEFKLGVYAYEQFYNGTNVEGEPIEMDDDYVKKVNETFHISSGIPTVNYKVFEELNNVFEEDKDEKGNSVLDNASLVYPRNIIYNKYLNIHSVYFIESDTPSERFREFKDTGKYILHAEVKPGSGKFEPVLAVRGSSQDKQEIHFIVVNRSPFEGNAALNKANREVNGVSLRDYYTTYFPNAQQPAYPKDAEGHYKETYVNFLSNEDSETKARAEEFASKLKSYDSDKIGKYIFLKYMNEESITFGSNQKLAKALMKWINTSVQKSADESKENWTKTVNDYIDKLNRQNSERKSLVPEACKIAFKYANRTGTTSAEDVFTSAGELATVKALLKADFLASGYATETNVDDKVDEELDKAVQDWFKTKGGVCNDGKAHL